MKLNDEYVFNGRDYFMLFLLTCIFVALIMFILAAWFSYSLYGIINNYLINHPLPDWVFVSLATVLGLLFLILIVWPRKVD